MTQLAIALLIEFLTRLPALLEAMEKAGHIEPKALPWDQLMPTPREQIEREEGMKEDKHV